jgi:hypothetical protein
MPVPGFRHGGDSTHFSGNRLRVPRRRHIRSGIFRSVTPRLGGSVAKETHGLELMNSGELVRFEGSGLALNPPRQATGE